MRTPHLHGSDEPPQYPDDEDGDDWAPDDVCPKCGKPWDAASATDEGPTVPGQTTPAKSAMSDAVARPAAPVALDVDLRRRDPLLDSDAWDGFALTVQALAEVEGITHGHAECICPEDDPENPDPNCAAHGQGDESARPAVPVLDLRLALRTEMGWSVHEVEEFLTEYGLTKPLDEYDPQRIDGEYAALQEERP